MAQRIQGSGANSARGLGKGSSSGRTALSMKDAGAMTKLKDSADLFMHRGTSMKEILKIISLTGMGRSCMRKGLFTKESSRMARNMEKGKRHGLMEHVTLEITFKERSTEPGSLFGKMDLFMKGNFMKILYKEQECISEWTGRNTMESGRLG